MKNPSTAKLDVEDDSSIQNVEENIGQYSAVLDRSFTDIKKVINSSSKVRSYTKVNKHKIEVQFCFSFGVMIVELTPYLEDSFKDPDKADKTQVVVLKNHIHSPEDNEKAFNILLKYLQNKN